MCSNAAVKPPRSGRLKRLVRRSFSYFHDPFWKRWLLKSVLFVQSMSIVGVKTPKTNVLKIEVAHYIFHELLPETMLSMLFQNKDVHQVSEYGEISNYPRKTHKAIVFVVDPEAQGVFNGLPYRLYCPVFPPIGSVADEIMDDRDIQFSFIGGYHIAVIQLLSPL